MFTEKLKILNESESTKKARYDPDPCLVKFKPAKNSMAVVEGAVFIGGHKTFMGGIHNNYSGTAVMIIEIRRYKNKFERIGRNRINLH